MLLFVQKCEKIFYPSHYYQTVLVYSIYAIYYHLDYHCSIRQEAFVPKKEVEITLYIPMTKVDCYEAGCIDCKIRFWSTEAQESW